MPSPAAAGRRRGDEEARLLGRCSAARDGPPRRAIIVERTVERVVELVVVVVGPPADVVPVVVQEVVPPHVHERVREARPRPAPRDPLLLRRRCIPPATNRRGGVVTVAREEGCFFFFFFGRRRRRAERDPELPVARAAKRQDEGLQPERPSGVCDGFRFRRARLAPRSAKPREVDRHRRARHAPRLPQGRPIHHPHAKRRSGPPTEPEPEPEPFSGRRGGRFVCARSGDAIGASPMIRRRSEFALGRRRPRASSSAWSSSLVRVLVVVQGERDSDVPVRVQRLQPRRGRPRHPRVRQLDVRVRGGFPLTVDVDGPEPPGAGDVDDERSPGPDARPRARAGAPQPRALDVVVVPPRLDVVRREHARDLGLDELVHAGQIAHRRPHRSHRDVDVGRRVERDVHSRHPGRAPREPEADQEPSLDREVGDVDRDPHRGHERGGFDDGADDDVRGDGAPVEVELELEVLRDGVEAGDVKVEIRRDDAEGTRVHLGVPDDARGHRGGVREDRRERRAGLRVDARADDRAPLVAEDVVDPLEGARLDAREPRVAHPRVAHRGARREQAALVHARREPRGEVRGGDDEDPVLDVEEHELDALSEGARGGGEEVAERGGRQRDRAGNAVAQLPNPRADARVRSAVRREREERRERGRERPARRDHRRGPSASPSPNPPRATRPPRCRAN